MKKILIETKEFRELDQFGFRRLQTPLEALNIVYPSANLDEQVQKGKLKRFKTPKKMKNTDPRATMVGKRGMNQCMNYLDESDTKNSKKI